MRSHILKILLVSNVLFVLASSLLGPLFTVFVQKFSNNILTISMIWAIFIGSTSIFMLVLYKYGDQIDKLKLLQLGFIIRAIAWIGFVFVGNIWTLLTIQVLLGLGEACGTPAFSALFAEHLHKDHHIADYSEQFIAYNLVGALATLTGGLIVNAYGFQTLFILMSTLAMSSLLITFKLTYLLKK